MGVKKCAGNGPRVKHHAFIIYDRQVFSGSSGSELPPRLSTEAKIRGIQQALKDVFPNGQSGRIKRYLNILPKEVVISVRI